MLKFNKRWMTGILVALLTFMLSTPSIASASGFHHPENWKHNSVLKQGKANKEVKNMQYVLNVMSYYTETGLVDVDGIFGPKTAAGVKKYQKENGLTADGIVGPKTWNSFSQYIKKKNTSTYGTGGFMGLRMEWKYDNKSDSSPSTATIFGNGTDKTDGYRLYAK
ncbi:Putative peptidoglycan binding domain-containing protein [Bacillus sp. OV194]|nr:Putative peptidoglycan binding domain-containing protein [Bacillus sp. OV194]